jgi:predicted hotdog family 3-hydroxylacyl-ACP dehydratase
MNSAAMEHPFTIAEVLPHEPPMRLLDEILEAGDERVSGALTIRRDSLFCDGVNGVPAWAGMEYMAQTASLYSGIQDLRQGMRPGICLLLGSRRYRAERPFFPIGSRLRVVATLTLMDDTHITAFDCTLYCEQDGESVVWARGDIKAYRPPDIQAVLRGERI